MKAHWQKRECQRTRLGRLGLAGFRRGLFRASTPQIYFGLAKCTLDLRNLQYLLLISKLYFGFGKNYFGGRNAWICTKAFVAGKKAHFFLSTSNANLVAGHDGVVLHGNVCCGLQVVCVVMVEFC